jgi:outer membrane protein
MKRALGILVTVLFLHTALFGEWPRRPAVLEELVAEAYAGNLAFKSQSLSVEEALEDLRQVQAHLQPRLDFVARYTRADGGRSIDIPVGDLLNPVYGTLNDLLAAQGQPGRFPSVSNQSIPLMREREQETKLRLIQPLYRPEITRGIRARRAAWQSREAQLAAFKRDLRLSVETAWFRAVQAGSAVQILESARGLTAEALRANRLLFENDKITEDRVLRAEAETLAVAQRLAEARRDQNTARAYLNFLLNRPLDAPLPSARDDELDAAVRSVTKPRDGGFSVTQREELQALIKAVEAAAAAEQAQKSRNRPTLALAIEGGIQGEDYATGPGHNFVMGSVVAEANIWDGRENRSAVRVAQLERKKLEVRFDETRQQLELQLQRAHDDWLAAVAGLETAERRRTASQRAFELVRERQNEGMVTQLSFIDARNELTSAELNLVITQHQLLIAAATLDRAAPVSAQP